MAVVVAGTVAAMNAGDEQRTSGGKVWLGDDGLVAVVTGRGDKAPAGFRSAATIDLGDAVIYPFLVDLHFHLAYNTLPLWAEPSQTEPYLHHDMWPGEPSYRSAVSWPAWTLADRAPECLLAHIQVRARGTTAAHGWPGLPARRANRLVRSIDDDQVGSLDYPVVRSALLSSRRHWPRKPPISTKAGCSFINCAKVDSPRWPRRVRPPNHERHLQLGRGQFHGNRGENPLIVSRVAVAAIPKPGPAS